MGDLTHSSGYECPTLCSTGPLVGERRAYSYGTCAVFANRERERAFIPISTSWYVDILPLHGHLTAAVVISPLWGAAFWRAAFWGGVYPVCGVMGQVLASVVCTSRQRHCFASRSESISGGSRGSPNRTREWSTVENQEPLFICRLLKFGLFMGKKHKRNSDGMVHQWCPTSTCVEEMRSRGNGVLETQVGFLFFFSFAISLAGKRYGTRVRYSSTVPYCTCCIR